MAPTRETVLKLTSFRYKKEGITEQEFHDFLTKYHAPKAAVVQARHGALKVAQYHTPSVTKKILTEKIPWALQPGWSIDDHDIMVSSLVAGESEICDTEKAHLTAGWEEVFVEDGKVVEGVFGSYEDRSNVGASSKRSEIEGDIKL